MGNIASERGQSSTLALAIIMALALAGALVIAGVGSLTLDQSQRVAETQSGVLLMTELDSRASLVALEGGDETKISLNERDVGGQMSVADRGELRLVMRNTSSQTLVWEENTSLGTVIYANGDERIAYQGGGVWRKNAGNGSVMVSPPEVHFKQGTLTLPMIRVNGSDQGMTKARLRKSFERRIYPRPEAGPNRSNPVPVGNQLSLFITSEFYQGWAAYFERRIGGTVVVYHGNNTVRVDLVSPEASFELDSGLISTGTGAPIDMQGNANNPTFVDSYDSSVGPYENSSSKNGNVRGDSGVELGGNSFIYGNVDTAGTVKLSGNDNLVDGDVFHRGFDDTGNNNTVTGILEENGSGVDISPITGVVNSRVNSICRNGSTITLGQELNGSSGSEYCHEGDLTLNGETLTVNLSDGNVSLAIDGDLKLKNDAEIRVKNPEDGNLTIWLGGSEVRMRSSNVTVPDDKSTALHLYGKETITVSMTSESEFTGLLFAPAADGSGAELSMQSNSQLYGAAVVGKVSMQSGSAVHYDQALGGFSFDRPGLPISHLSYLYVSVNDVKVEDDS